MEGERGGSSSSNSGNGGRRKGRGDPLESLILRKVGEVSSAIAGAKRVDEVICALHSIAHLLFPVDLSLLSGSLDQRYRIQILDAEIPTEAERDDWRHAFYLGPAFPSMARILIYDVASNWLACFPLSARKQVYDSFFVRGPVADIVQALVPGLTGNGPSEDVDYNAVCANVEWLLVLCLLESNGAYSMAKEFGDLCGSKENWHELLKPNKLALISNCAQLLASLPDKARPEALPALSSHLFFKQIIIQLLVAAEERAIESFNRKNAIDETVVDGTFSFVGETFARICRRGSTGTLLVVIIPRILQHIRNCLVSNSESTASTSIESKPEFSFWSKIVEEIKDPYAVERLSEELLRQLVNENVSDVEAYWILWMLFDQAFKHQVAIRAMFCDKFLLWKVFPLCCLRWILQFSVLESPPYVGVQTSGQNTRNFLNIVQRLVGVWSKSDLVQSASMEQQAYITAAVGLSLERMSKEELETTKDVLHSILQGVSCRLESPIYLVRRMASSIALVFSRVVDPNNPLYLEDDCSDTIDWEFGLISQQKGISSDFHDKESCTSNSRTKEISNVTGDKRDKYVKGKVAKSDITFSNFRTVDPDEIIDPIMLNTEYLQDEEEDVGSEDSEASSDSSLQPYDLADDDADLQRKFSQLSDIVVALRKPDDPDGVERALDIAERLVRASPDELRHNAGDLVNSLVHIRCSDVTIEGEEDSAEGKRQKALVALLVTCPFESLIILNKLLYSPSVDVGQRFLILDVMTDAALELADAKTVRMKQANLISTIPGSPSWFIPSTRGPPGVGPWKEVAETGSYLSWSHRYERELPSKPGHMKGKSRRWGIGAAKMQDNHMERSRNKFPLYAAAFMLPAMQGFDKRRHGVDLLDRDFIVLGKLIYMLGVCMKCMAMHPEASALAPALLDMLSSRSVAYHAESYVRRSVLFAASCILAALHPSYLASALIEGDQEISKGLEWIRTWALQVAESDSDTECSSMAVACLQLHAEIALQTSRSLESADCFKPKTGILPLKTNEIIMPFSKMEF